MESKSQNPFEGAKFDVEHALNIYADSYCTFPVQNLYDKDFVNALKNSGRAFHIYLIGYIPKVETLDISQNEDSLCVTISILGKEHKLRWNLPAGFSLKKNGERAYLEDDRGEKRWLSDSDMRRAITLATGGYRFDVRYVGQGYGSDGSRDAIDRLLKHETLQKIAIERAPAGHEIQILLLEIQAPNRIFSVFLPEAQKSDTDGVRRKQGLDKLFHSTSDAERISLFEAALIRYFLPQFNKEFKNSFPSTNLKILQDCYAKDFLALVAEICIDDFPFFLCSENVEPKHYHIITYDLQNDAERRVFLGL